MAEHNELGMRGEEIAAAHLADGSYSILEKNWRSGHLEVDIIALRGDQLVIAEVKTRTRGFLETLTGTVNKRKQKLLMRAANAYIRKNDLDVDVRFDIITVIFEGDDYRIDHIENAFSAVG